MAGKKKRNARKTVGTAEAVINELGGPYQVGRLFDIDGRVVWNWKVRGLPADTYVALMAELRKRRVGAAPAVWRMREIVKA